MTNQQKLLAFFGRKQVRECISIKALAKHSNVGYCTLNHFMNGIKYRHLSDEQADRVIDVLNSLKIKL